MSVPTRHRFTLLACALLLAPALFAAAPSGRTAARMVYDTKTGHMILFGGSTKLDQGTRQSYDLADTWDWTGDRWVLLYPAHAPHGRSFHTMSYDSARNRVILFGGKSGTTTTNSVLYNDTWQFDGTDWSQINTPSSPSARFYSSSVYDPIRDRVVLFGGTSLSSDGKTSTNLYDTWEFDGTTWTQTQATGPTVIKPILTYDSQNNRVILVGADDKNATKMYRYDAQAKSWTQITTTTVPSCATDAQMVYEAYDNKIVLVGGVCSDSAIDGDTWEYDGNDWAKVSNAADPDRRAAEALAYDPIRQATVMFGGTLAFGNPTGQTVVYQNHVWATPPDANVSPAPRSLFVFASNPDDKSIYLFGGQNDNGLPPEFWKYQNGDWTRLSMDKAPTICPTPNGAYDTDRKKLVVVCSDSTTFEFDGTTWADVTPSKTKPTLRGFSSMVYDQTLKKTVLFGGFTEVNYIDETWTWDGTTWARVKKNSPTPRALAAMWFDPTLKKTVIFGGIGRRTSDGRIERFNDMWSFDGNGWTEMKNVANPPSARYGSQVAIDPRSGQVLLFGGLVLQVSGATQNQVYSNDLWSWNGSSWSQLTATGAVPPARENGALAFDPSSNRMILFAGFSGYYLSDLWSLDDKTTWTLQAESAAPPAPVVPPRRRGAGH